MADPATTISIGAALAIIGSVIATVLGGLGIFKIIATNNSVDAQRAEQKLENARVADMLTAHEKSIHVNKAEVDNLQRETSDKHHGVLNRLDQVRAIIKETEDHQRETAQRVNDDINSNIARIEQKQDRMLDMLFDYIKANNQ